MFGVDLGNKGLRSTITSIAVMTTCLSYLGLSEALPALGFVKAIPFAMSTSPILASLAIGALSALALIAFIGFSSFMVRAMSRQEDGTTTIIQVNSQKTNANSTINAVMEPIKKALKWYAVPFLAFGGFSYLGLSGIVSELACLGIPFVWGAETMGLTFLAELTAWHGAAIYGAIGVATVNFIDFIVKYGCSNQV